MAMIRLLGGFGLEHPDRGPIAIATCKGRALLAYLACAKKRAVPRDSLALLLWSDSDKGKSRRNLRHVLFKLSRTLAKNGLPIIRTDSQSVALCGDGLWVDAWELDSLADEPSVPVAKEVMSLYQGEFLHGLTLDAPVFGDWLADVRAHYQSRALYCLHTLLARRREAGDFEAAITAGIRALEIDSSQEQSHRSLMELYLANGMRDAALIQYRTCQSVLRRDLDVAPDRATETLYRQIRDTPVEVWGRVN